MLRLLLPAVAILHSLPAVLLACAPASWARKAAEPQPDAATWPPPAACCRVIHEAAGAKAVPLYLAMIALHCGLGLALKLYFFQFAQV